MDSPPKIRSRTKKREAYMLGVPPPKNWAPRNKTLLLTYRGHIPKLEYKRWFSEVIMDGNCKKGVIERLVIAHEIADTVHDYNHTHVVIWTSEAIRSRVSHLFAWKYTKRCNIGQLSLEHVSILRSDVEARAALYTLAAEDPECSRYLHRKYEESYNRVMYDRDVSVPLDGGCQAQYLSDNPIFKISRLVGWQSEVAKLMLEEVERTRLNFLWLQPRAGATSLVRAVHYRDPIRFHLIGGLPSLELIRQIRDIELTQWNRDSIILDIGSHEAHKTLSSVISELVSLLLKIKYKSLWVISTAYHPDILPQPLSWYIYRGGSSWKDARVDNLARGRIVEDEPDIEQ